MINRLYVIIFDDDTKFEGGDCTDTKWLEIPNKKIRSLFYSLPFGDCICLSGYDKYYQFIEAVVDLNGDKKGQKIIEHIYVIGVKDKAVRIYKISLKNKKIDIIDTDNEDKFIKELNPIGWR